MADTLLLAWPLRILVALELVVTPKLGVFLLLGGILVVHLNIVGRFGPWTVSIVAAELLNFRETFDHVVRDLRVRTENKELSRGLPW